MKTLIYPFFLLLAATPLAGQINEPQNNKVILKLKVYLDSKHPYSDMTDNFNLRVDEIIDRSITESTIKSGRISMELKLNKHYIIYLSRNGYETKSLVFSTVGARIASKNIFHADVILRRIGDEEYNEKNQTVASVKYDYMNSQQFIIKEADSKINFMVK